MIYRYPPAPITISGMFLPLSGGTLSGVLNMGGNRIEHLDDPVADDDAATKAYVDSKASTLPITTKGDLIAGNATGVGTRLPVGTNGQVLVSSSAATLGVAWTNSLTAINSATFNTAPTPPAYAAGNLFWEADDNTLSIHSGLDSTSLQIGQESWIKVRNNTGVAIPEATAVMYTGTIGGSGRITAAPMVADGSIASQYLLGITTMAIPDNGDGMVTNFGKLRGVNTNSWAEGAVLWLDPATPGGLTSTMPDAPNLRVPVAYVVTKSASAGCLFVDVQYGSDLSQDRMVHFGTLLNGDLLVYNSSTHRWENSPATALLPITTKGDLVAGNVTGTPVRFATGADGQVLTASSSSFMGLTWADPQPTPITTKGDMLAGDSGGAPARLPSGTDGQVLVSSASAPLGVAWADPSTPPGVSLNGTCDGRLSLTTDSYSSTDAIGVGTLYFVPHAGDQVSLYSGSSWSMYTFSTLSLALVVASGRNYDVFLWNNAGTLTLELSTAWTSDTARATALVLQDGVWVQSGATTRRYLGTIRASGTNICEDSATKRYVWNLYNPLRKPLIKSTALPSTTSFSGTGTQHIEAWAADSTGTYAVRFVVGLVREPILVSLAADTAVGSSASPPVYTELPLVGLNLDDTTHFDSALGFCANTSPYQSYGGCGGARSVGIGFHTLYVVMRRPVQTNYWVNITAYYLSGSIAC